MTAHRRILYPSLEPASLFHSGPKFSSPSQIESKNFGSKANNESRSIARVFGSKKRQFGDRGEKIAERYLYWRGYRIIERNMIAGRFGEIDLIAIRKGVLIFIEVKTRQSTRFGTAEEAVSETKLIKLENAIMWYLQNKNLENIRYQLDVIAIDWSMGRSKIRHHKNLGVG